MSNLIVPIYKVKSMFVQPLSTKMAWPSNSAPMTLNPTSIFAIKLFSKTIKRSNLCPPRSATTKTLLLSASASTATFFSGWTWTWEAIKISLSRLSYRAPMHSKRVPKTSTKTSFSRDKSSAETPIVSLTFTNLSKATSIVTSLPAETTKKWITLPLIQ